jgi:hypothetical protein
MNNEVEECDGAENKKLIGLILNTTFYDTHSRNERFGTIRQTLRNWRKLETHYKYIQSSLTKGIPRGLRVLVYPKFEVMQQLY